MGVDTSAVLAILLEEEPEAAECAQLTDMAIVPRIRGEDEHPQSFDQGESEA